MSQTQIYDVFKKPVIWLLVLSDNNDFYTVNLKLPLLISIKNDMTNNIFASYHRFSQMITNQYFIDYETVFYV